MSLFIGHTTWSAKHSGIYKLRPSTLLCRIYSRPIMTTLNSGRVAPWHHIVWKAGPSTIPSLRVIALPVQTRWPHASCLSLIWVFSSVAWGRRSSLEVIDAFVLDDPCSSYHSNMLLRWCSAQVSLWAGGVPTSERDWTASHFSASFVQ